ncbi:hypothetical protein GOP47_0016595 [Adiantum capillus-veneris]|uniref:CW-type domain-containing protein n=1 Tax=Adiantum capillus-veneris TaxID=13818 RepID=A0A9D4UI37_ADICA|nr:hypothetical protein GOP47_0016595 [Adiantum capillus-veneris]
MKFNASVDKLMKRMTADHLAGDILLSPLRELVCEPVKERKSGNSEVALVVPRSRKEAQHDSKRSTSIKKHKKASAKHADNESLVTHRMAFKGEMKLVQEDAMVTSDMRSSPSHPETSLCPPTCNGLMKPATKMPIIRVIQQEWVCCDSCEKWRLLPPGVGSAQLPEQWTCKMLYWLPGLNQCKVSEEITTNLVEPHYDANVEQSRLPILRLSQHCGRSQDIKRSRTEPSNKIGFDPGLKENESLTASIQATSPAKLKKPLIRAKKVVTDDGHWSDTEMRETNLIEIEVIKLEDEEEAKCLRGNDGLVYDHSSLGFTSSEATKLKQQTRQVSGPIDDKALYMYMKAAIRFLQAAALLESGGAKSGNEELLVNIYVEAASLSQLCADMYETNAELATAILAHKCISCANLNLIQLIGSFVLSDADKLHSLQQRDTSGGNIVIPPESCATYEHVMDYVDLTNSAMDSIKKSNSLLMTIRETFTLSANILVLLENVLNFDVQNVGELMELVCEAMRLLNVKSLAESEQSSVVVFRQYSMYFLQLALLILMSNKENSYQLKGLLDPSHWNSVYLLISPIQQCRLHSYELAMPKFVGSRSLALDAQCQATALDHAVTKVAFLTTLELSWGFDSCRRYSLPCLGGIRILILDTRPQDKTCDFRMSLQLLTSQNLGFIEVTERTPPEQLPPLISSFSSTKSHRELER